MRRPENASARTDSVTRVTGLYDIEPLTVSLLKFRRSVSSGTTASVSWIARIKETHSLPAAQDDARAHPHGQGLTRVEGGLQFKPDDLSRVGVDGVLVVDDAEPRR